MAQCRTCGEHGKAGLSLLEPENASLLQFIIKHLQPEVGGSFSTFVCHDCVVEVKHWGTFLTRFQTSQTHFHHLLAHLESNQDSPQQTDVEAPLQLAECQVVVTKLLECESCSFYTNSKATLETHMRTHLPPSTSDWTRTKRHPVNSGRKFSLKCVECGLKYVYPEMLAWHTENCHGTNAIVKIMKISDQKYSFQCVCCKSMYKDINLIIRHLRVEHQLINLPFQCKVCSKQFIDRYSLRKHQLTCQNKNSGTILRYHYKCDTCAIRYGNPEMLAWHTENCHGTNAIVQVIKIGKKIHNFQCVFCKSVCTNLQMIIQHLYNQHNISNLPFVCKVCNVSYMLRSGLNYHQSRCKNNKTVNCIPLQAKHNIHRDVPASQKSGVVCKMCNKIFESEKQMQNHISKFHAIERYRYKCGHCDCKFNLFYRLKSHCHARHPGKYVLQCDICNAEFNSLSCYIKHKKYIHEGHVFTCNICSATLSDPSNLRRHIEELHSLVKKYLCCKFCSSKFKCESYLRQHVHYMHTGPVLHCEHCQYTTRRKSDLIIHLQRRHF